MDNTGAHRDEVRPYAEGLAPRGGAEDERVKEAEHSLRVAQVELRQHIGRVRQCMEAVQAHTVEFEEASNVALKATRRLQSAITTYNAAVRIYEAHLDD